MYCILAMPTSFLLALANLINVCMHVPKELLSYLILLYMCKICYTLFFFNKGILYMYVCIFIFNTSDKNLNCLIIVSPEKPPVPPNSRSYKSSVTQGANN